MSSTKATMPPPTRGNPEECWTCKGLGKPCMHDYRECKEAKRWRESTYGEDMADLEGKCWTCAQDGRPSNHNWRECKDAMAAYYKRRVMDTASWNPPKEKKGKGSR